MTFSLTERPFATGGTKSRLMRRRIWARAACVPLDVTMEGHIQWLGKGYSANSAMKTMHAGAIVLTKKSSFVTN